MKWILSIYLLFIVTESTADSQFLSHSPDSPSSSNSPSSSSSLNSSSSSSSPGSHPPKEFLFPIYEPYTFKINGRFEGIYPEIIRAIYGQKGIEVKFTEVSFARHYSNFNRGVTNSFAGSTIDLPGVSKGELDQLLPVYFVRDELLFAYNRTAFPSQLKDESFRGKKALIMQNIGTDFQVVSRYTDRYETVNQIEQILRMITRGRADFTSVNGFTYQLHIAKDPSIKEQLRAYSTGEVFEFGMVYRKEAKEECELFVEGLNSLKESGAYEKIFQSWGERYQLENTDIFMLKALQDVNQTCQ